MVVRALDERGFKPFEPPRLVTNHGQVKACALRFSRFGHEPIYPTTFVTLFFTKILCTLFLYFILSPSGENLPKMEH